jgi:hypothetical protein
MINTIKLKSILKIEINLSNGVSYDQLEHCFKPLKILKT